jgi:nucleoside-diphosphate-sugar epimerase
MDVRDMGRAIATLATAELAGAINLGSGEPVRLGDVARMLGEIAGLGDLVRLGALPDRPGEAEILIPDLTRQTRELGFRPRIRLGDGLRDAYDHWARESSTTELHS